MNRRRKNQVPPVLLGMLYELPPEGEAWTADDRSRFMAVFAQLLDHVVPVNDNCGCGHNQEEAHSWGICTNPECPCPFPSMAEKAKQQTDEFS